MTNVVNCFVQLVILVEKSSVSNDAVRFDEGKAGAGETEKDSWPRISLQ